MSQLSASGTMPNKSFCSLMSQQNKEDPIGSAASHTRYLFVEVPFPWDYNVRESRNFPAGLHDLLTECTEKAVTPFRFLAFCGEVHTLTAGSVRVFTFQRPSHEGMFDKREYIVPMPELPALVASFALQTDTLAVFDPYLQPTDNIREIFICTHGSHDTCCGKFGYPIYKQLNEQYGEQAGVRAWRTSHFGGHRFAPTLIDFPDGRYYAAMRTDLLDAFVYQKQDAPLLKRHYRGWGALNKFEQVAERELFMRYGWQWRQFELESAWTAVDDDTAVVTMRYASPDRTITGTYEAEVYVTGTIPISGCGSEGESVKQFGLRPVLERHS